MGRAGLRTWMLRVAQSAGEDGLPGRSAGGLSCAAIIADQVMSDLLTVLRMFWSVRVTELSTKAAYRLSMCGLIASCGAVCLAIPGNERASAEIIMSSGAFPDSVVWPVILRNLCDGEGRWRGATSGDVIFICLLHLAYWLPGSVLVEGRVDPFDGQDVWLCRRKQNL
jgi:hypothetical protein